MSVAKMPCVVEFENGKIETFDSFTAAANAAQCGECTISPQKGGE